MDDRTVQRDDQIGHRAAAALYRRVAITTVALLAGIVAAWTFALPALEEAGVEAVQSGAIVGGCLLAAVGGFGASALFCARAVVRMRELRRPGTITFTSSRTSQLERSLSTLRRIGGPASTELPDPVPYVFGVVMDSAGLVLTTAGRSAEPFLRLSWLDVARVDVAPSRDGFRRTGGLVVELSIEGHPLRIPLTVDSDSVLLRQTVPPQQLRAVAFEVERLRQLT
ncbi:hypothetical protein [Herbiconiux sp. VKM Ac-2851]|uniref:hypothetical protein n=1 Tax=Herbiconiux sp. VKM Ac-2851 TaxID=2739025 RepID=UPI001564AED4|nr:hypothetical protein [Herbiconiux sp. VKM Ac-2851]NQX35966.1 hypothetical protein [Herbiconiux sp. VKM Ac-2851]